MSKKWGIIMGRRQGSNVSFISSKKMWTFGSGLLLCQRFRRRCEETAWKRRRIETGLVIVIVMSHVFTHVVSYKLFGD